ncbi:uncharacterized protein LOC110713297 [Chenopodium quinoa]|uniref:uncharacterized protein LOC110713297 n=1 Tax=Chenopodium quinoa TaxID=63459 RepID=UPI000B7876E1|nr:uncharacterized protein LOC110713297 [Chenopodium quinoa]
MAVSDKKFNEMMTHNKMLENQISQLANALKDHASLSSLPSQGLDPKKHVNAIVSRCGKVLEERLPRNGEDKEIPKEALVENEGDRASLDEVVVETPTEDILSGKRNCEVVETINLTKNCSAIIMNKMPPKLKDPGDFSIPCAINNMQIDNALCDLEASVSIMPYSDYQRLELGNS